MEQHRRKYNSDLSHQWKRKSLRLKTHNYGYTASYFITLSASVFESIFEIPELHAILAQTWEGLPTRFPSVTLDEFVIMPDHVHFIIHLEGNVKESTTLGSVVGAYKSLTTVAWLRHVEAAGRECMEYPGIIWQPDYFERIIRDTQELENTRQYIRNNPIKLQQQQEQEREQQEREQQQR